MALVNANNLKIGIATAASDTQYPFLAHAQDASLSFSNSLIDVTTKSSNSWMQKISGQKSFSLSSSGLLDYADVADAANVVGTGGAGSLSTLALAGTQIYFQFTIGTQGYKGSGFVSSLDQSGGTDDAPTYSISIEGTGVLEFDSNVTA